MSWFEAIGNLLVAQSHAQAQHATLVAEQRRMYMQMRQDCNPFLAGSYYTGAPLPKPPRRACTQSKCDSCGSREWLAHAGKEVCAYCRSDRGVAVEQPIPRAPRPGFGNDPGPY